MARSISIVVPFYNKKTAFKKTFSTLLLQLDHEDEIVVADDHSPSGVGTCPCLKELTVVRPPKLETHIYRLNTLRNLGIMKAKHDAVVVLDPDCIPNDYFLENARRIFDPSVLFAGRIDYLDKNGTILKLDERRGDSSLWLDDSLDGGSKILGEVMFFSKSRVELVGLFDTEYDSGWGAEDHDFGERCYSSGMRLRYEPALAVQHQWHPKVKPNQQRNLDLWHKKRANYVEHLDKVTPYNPAVGVLIATLQRPHYIDQVMRGVFRTRAPMKVRLVNQGDHSPEQLKALKWWRGRWAVDVVDNPEPRRLSEVRTEAMESFREEGYKYMMTMDDDILPTPGSIVELLRALLDNPQYHAIAGGVIQKDMNRMLGGYITQGDETQHHVLPLIKGITEVDFVSSGFTAFNLKPLIPYDTEYEFGWNDWDWSQEIKKAGLRMAVCGDAVAHHKYLVTHRGITPCYDSAKYNRLRRDIKRNEASKNRFKKKWGFKPAQPKQWDKLLREAPMMKSLKQSGVPYVETVRVQDIESPVYSIVVPVRNLYGARVRNCLRSLQLQTVGNLEVIIVDYGSTPENHRRLMETLKPFNCTVLRFPTNDVWSMSISRNIGLRRARGEYVATLDADCFLTPLVLKFTLNIHIERPRLITMAPYYLEENVDVENIVLPRDYEKLRAGGPRYLKRSIGGFMSAPRSWWLKVRGFDERMKLYGCEDGDLCKRAEMDPEIETYIVEENYESDIRFYHQWHTPMRLYQTAGVEVVKRQYEINRLIKKNEYSIRRNAGDWGVMV